MNELIDYCVRPGLIIASSIINDIVDKFETESSLHLALMSVIKKHKFTDGIRHLQKYPIEQNKIPKSTFLKNLNTQLKFVIPKSTIKEWVTYPIIEKINKGTGKCKFSQILLSAFSYTEYLCSL